jgi:MFS family permease
MRRPGPASYFLRHTVAALLQLERPVPPRTEAELVAEAQRHYRWNFVVNLIDGTAFFFGLSFVSGSTIAPLFVSKLTSSTLAIGLLAVLAQAGWFLPQILTANGVERLPRKKPVVVNLGLFLERLPMVVLVIAALLAGRRPALALALFLAGYAWRVLGSGTVGTAWQDLVARCFPVARRGRFLGVSTFAGTGMGAAGAALSTWLLRTFPFPANFAYTFAIGAASLLLGWLFLAQTREPVAPVDLPRQSNRQFLSSLPGIVRRDANFRRFLVARSLLALGSLGSGFVTVAALRRWQVPDATVGLFTAASLLGQTAANLAFGFLADHFGHKLSLELGALASVLAFSLAWLAPSPGWYFAVFALLGVNLGAIIVSGILVTLEFSPPARRPTYTGLVNTAVGLTSIVAPLLGAGLASIGYGWLFALGAAVNGAALVAMRYWVREPRWAVPPPPAPERNL